MNIKRRRIESSVVQQENNHLFPRDDDDDDDYYDEIMRVMYNKDNNNDYNDLVTPNSWMRNFQWISRLEPTSSNTNLSTQSTQETTNEDSDSDFKKSLDRIKVQNKLKQVALRLVEVKQRLTPAAEKYAIVTTANSNLPPPHGDKSVGCSRVAFQNARRYSNPYEALGERKHGGLNNLFMNRAAIKLANIDAALGFCLTTINSNHDKGGQLLFSFADLCAAPGGFSEYIIWRCISNGTPMINGFAMSLTGENEDGKGTRWRLDDFSEVSNNTTVQYRICKGADGTGDIYKWGNIEYLQNIIQQYNNEEPPSEQEETEHPSEGSGKVNLVVADGGFDAQRDVENQEQVALKLIIYEIAAALSLLQQDGTFVIKMFGFQTPVIRSAMDYLFLLFRDIIAIKPISSRPASAERYVCCSGFSGSPEGWNGEQWCSSILKGDNCSTDNSIDTVKISTRLHDYLDKFDRDLNKLNLKACLAILSYLETSSSGGSPLKSCIAKANMNAYKYAWHLV